jgi:acyl-CoA synthetase (AMP-forming)/AMP-acid ligase II
MTTHATLVDVLAHRAATQPDDRAYLFLSDQGAEEASLTYAELLARASALAARIAPVAAPGDRALLVFPSGLEFVVALFGCFIARVIAVPIMVPRRQSARDTSAGIMADCAAVIGLTSAALDARQNLSERFPGLPWMTVDLAAANDVAVPPRPAAEDVAFLQYTSGSTSHPKGVVITHRNLIANEEMMRISLGNSERSTCVNWIPHFHDMGLIFGVLHPLYLGSLSVLMSPNAFMQRPIMWLRAISRYRAETVASPNFGYDLCVSRFKPELMEGIDLSGWKVMCCGAEPIRAETLRRFTRTFAPYGFDSRAVFPCYGMAETTLEATGRMRGAGYITRSVSRAALQAHRIERPRDQADTHDVVGCGRAVLDERVAIVDPDSGLRLGADRIGEIWVSGDNVATAYWRDDEATRERLRARLPGEDGDWLRTGDLGFLDVTGELFVTGRIKEMIIVRGMNHYPQDIERAVQAAHPALRQNGGAAFSIEDERGEEQLVIVQEVEREARNKIDPEEITGLIREAVTNGHEIYARHIVLIPPNALPKTTSGKVQRRLTRRLWQDGKLDFLKTGGAARAPLRPTAPDLDSRSRADERVKS